MKGLAVMLALALTGCASGSSYQPRTVEGAQCKQRCSTEMAMCQAMPYTCRDAASTCMSTCAEMEALKR